MQQCLFPSADWFKTMKSELLRHKNEEANSLTDCVEESYLPMYPKYDKYKEK